MAKMLENKNIIVTGCARGMGHKMLEVFAANGANLWGCARKEDKDLEAFMATLSDTYGVRVTPVYFDLTDYTAMKAAVKQIMSLKAKVDGLVNNAGITYNALFQMSTLEEIHRTMEINFVAPFIFTQYIVKLMLRGGGGSIVNIASSAAEDGNSGRSVYGASKAAVICETKAIAEELGEKGIRANAIAPGITHTDMITSMSEDVIQATINDTALRRIGQTIDIANTAMYLLSDYSSYITGQVIRVDGGLQ